MPSRNLSQRGPSTAVNSDSFSQGYLDGWRSVRGDNEQLAVPPGPAAAGRSVYLVGFERGARDAMAVSIAYCGPTLRAPGSWQRIGGESLPRGGLANHPDPE
jgi:hypothetical protein